MFDSKLKSILDSEKKTSGSVFVAEGLKESSKTVSANGALKYSSTGDDFVDQFGNLGKYKSPRTYSDISRDMSILWAKNPRLALCFVFFMRIITRVVSFFDGTKTTVPQRGAGLKHESIMRMIWVHVYHPDAFWNNIQLFISTGSWKDIFTMMRYDLIYNGWDKRKLDWNKFLSLILAGLENPGTSELVKKYLPQLKAHSACKTVEAEANTMIAKYLSNFLFGKKQYASYRKLKSSGTAHKWQQLISKKLFNEIDFDTVHGKALMLMVSGKFLTNNNLEERYEKWISSKPLAKFTGYVHELFKPIASRWGDGSLKKYQIDTINAQFAQAVNTAKEGIKTETSFIVVRDTSSSMTADIAGYKGYSAYSLGKALALFFSEMLPKGKFAGSWIEFANNATLHTWKGSTPYEKFVNDRSEAYGDTNFLSVIDLFCKLKKSVPEQEFPTGILCISDGEFNPTNLNETNVQVAYRFLREAGFTEDFVNNFKIVLWNVQTVSGYVDLGNKFETHGDAKNVFYFSGYDGSIISFLTGSEAQVKPPQTAKELFLSAMDQEVMSRIVI